MPSPPTNAIEVRALAKRFGEREALAGIDLQVDRGSCFGLLGPNGAGKSTTVGILTTLLAPSAGEARVMGRDVVAERAAVRRSIGVVFQEPSLDPELSAREQLELHARLFRLESPAQRVERELAGLGLGEHADRPVRALSGGLRRRVELARGLLGRPGVLFLDEPTTGLDPAARATLWEALRRLQGETTLFLTTHSMEEADALCDQLAILDAGRVAARGSPDALKSALGGDVVTLLLERPEQALSAVAALEGVSGVEHDAEARALRVTVREGSRRLPALLEAARGSGVLEVDLRRPSLEHVFLHHTGHAFAEAEADVEGAGR